MGPMLTCMKSKSCRLHLTHMVVLDMKSKQHWRKSKAHGPGHGTFISTIVEQNFPYRSLQCLTNECLTWAFNRQ